MAIERVQKILARAGVSSRRAAEQLIADGRVRVNGRIVKELGTKADGARDRVEVDGKRVVAEQPVYYLLHKPREVVTTLDDPEQRESVADLLKRVRERVFPVGRLDFHTSGALLMTNDGEMAQALLHPRKRVPKIYVAKLRGEVAIMSLQRLRQGVVLDDGHKTAPADVFVSNQERGNTWLTITITEGKNRQIHRMADAVGHRVQRLFRMSFAGLTVDGMRPGEFRTLSDSEIAKLKRDYLNPSKKDKFEKARDARRARMEGADAEPEARPARPRRPASGPRAPRKKTSSAREFSSSPSPARGPRKNTRRGPAKRMKSG
jgi:23S rRNA pseudouridine2605 synthase